MPRREHIIKRTENVWTCHKCGGDIIPAAIGIYITKGNTHVFQFHTDCIIEHLKETYIPTDIPAGS